MTSTTLRTPDALSRPGREALSRLVAVRRRAVALVESEQLLADSLGLSFDLDAAWTLPDGAEPPSDAAWADLVALSRRATQALMEAEHAARDAAAVLLTFDAGRLDARRVALLRHLLTTQRADDWQTWEASYVVALSAEGDEPEPLADRRAWELVAGRMGIGTNAPACIVESLLATFAHFLIAAPAIVRAVVLDDLPTPLDRLTNVEPNGPNAVAPAATTKANRSRSSQRQERTSPSP